MTRKDNHQNVDLKNSRKTYNKPILIRVNLVAKEAVLSSGCKTSGYSASGAVNACNPSPVPTCRENGS